MHKVPASVGGMDYSASDTAIICRRIICQVEFFSQVCGSLRLHYSHYGGSFFFFVRLKPYVFRYTFTEISFRRMNLKLI